MTLDAWTFVNETDRLSEDQLEAVGLPFDQNQLIIGIPGSGKTVVAAHRGIRIKKESPVQILVFNKLLFNSLQKSLKSFFEEEELSTLISWFNKWFYKQYGEYPPKDDGSFWPNWYECRKIADQDHITKISMAKHDTLESSGTHFIIDEAQDVPPDLWHFLKLAAGKCNITVLLDENKAESLQESDIKTIKQQLDITDQKTLGKDFRCSSSIREFAFICHTRGNEKPLFSAESSEGEVGNKPTLSCFSDMPSTVKEIWKVGTKARDATTVVALPTDDLLTRYDDLLRDEPIMGTAPQRYYSDHKDWAHGTPLSFDTPGIKILSWESLRGLEFETLFIPEIQTLDTSEFKREQLCEWLYLLASRTKTSLHISYSGEGEPKRIIELLPLDLLEDKRSAT